MRPGFGLGVALLAIGVWLVGVGTASATMPMQKKAKEQGFDAANCQYCHVDKLPKKEAATLNERGQWLVAEKEKQKAKEIDVSWLKNYVEKGDSKK
jgi:hypothetical protein